MKYLGVDFGLRRVGLAISEGQLASPLKVIEIKNLEEAIALMIRIIKTEGVDRVIVGLPEGKTGKLAMKFISKLKASGLNVEPFDETLSSKNAISKMIELGISRKERARNDAYSAAIILQNFLDQ